MQYQYLYYKGKRPNNSKEFLKVELIQYLRERYSKGHIPSRMELENNFHLKLDSLFRDIDSLYKEAGLVYKTTANQHLKYYKAKLLLDIVVKNANKFNLNIIKTRGVNERGIDIVAVSNEDTIGVELKAYCRREKVKNRNIIQIIKQLNKEKIKKAILITTTNLRDKNLLYDDRITVIHYNQLSKLITDKLDKKRLNYIRNFSVNRIDNEHMVIKQRILDYVSQKYKAYKIKPSFIDIQKDLHVNLYTYFTNYFEIYKELKIPPPTKDMGGRMAKNPDQECIDLWKYEFKKFITEEISKGNKYPSGEEIGKHFGISHIWSIVKVAELYRELGLKPYLERKNRHKVTSPPNV